MQLLQRTLSDINLERARGRMKAGLMTHVVLGYPSLKESLKIVQAMADSGASIIELQIPFSDPMADGPTIMAANETALAAGVTPVECMRAMEYLRRRVQVPLLFMSYANILFAYSGGIKGFLRDAAQAGAEGIIAADLPPDETREHFWELAYKNQVIPIPIVSPITDIERLDKIAKLSRSGFVYCVSTTGTTGARKELAAGMGKYLHRVRRHFNIPLAVGFGISSRKQIHELAPYAEIAVVGSATIDIIRKADRRSRVAKVRKFIRELTR